MSRIERKFRELKKKKQKALIVFMTAGDPSLSKNLELARAFERDGVDLIEIGMPFSDPLADGPVIQASSQRSLARGTTLKMILKLVRSIRRTSSLPIVLMGYLNPILHHGLSRFAADAAAAGADGLIVPDLPPEEGADVSKALRAKKLDLIYLLAPTSPPARRKVVARASRGFVYYVSITGVTGFRRSLPTTLRRDVRDARAASRLPVCVGFGISDPAKAREVSRTADGVIVGSALVDAMARHPKMPAAAFSRRFVRPFARAVGKKV